jgi:hypothetical protein
MEFQMTPDCANEKLLLERRLQFLKLTDALLHVDEPAIIEYNSFRRWFLDEEFVDVHSREALIDSLKKIETVKQTNEVSQDKYNTEKDCA